MIAIEEIPISRAHEFWKQHIEYLIQDGIITEKEDLAYFQSNEYRSVLEAHMERDTDRHHMVYFMEEGQRIGAAQYCTYLSEDGKCFILDFWVFPSCRGGGTGHRCFSALEERAKSAGAVYFELNSDRENAIRFWKDNGFLENGVDEYGMQLFIKPDPTSAIEGG